jgi:hypothetical protein
MGHLIGMILAIEPFHDVEVARAVELDWVAVEEIGHHHEVAVGGELVGDQVGVVEAVANDVCDAEDGQYDLRSPVKNDASVERGMRKVMSLT